MSTDDVNSQRRLLSPRQVCDVLNISRATWNRTLRHQLPIVSISTRRIGVWNTDLEAFAARRTAAPDQAA